MFLSSINSAQAIKRSERRRRSWLAQLEAVDHAMNPTPNPLPPHEQSRLIRASRTRPTKGFPWVRFTKKRMADLGLTFYPMLARSGLTTAQWNKHSCYLNGWKALMPGLALALQMSPSAFREWIGREAEADLPPPPNRPARPSTRQPARRRRNPGGTSGC